MSKVLPLSLLFAGLGLFADASPLGGDVDEVQCLMWANLEDIETDFQWCVCVTEHDRLFD